MPTSAQRGCPNHGPEAPPHAHAQVGLKSDLEQRKAKPPTKRKNSEKRKAKSRDAAKIRRNTESEMFAEIGALLPMPASIVDQMDKISIMRLALSFVKARHLSLNCPPQSQAQDKEGSFEACQVTDFEALGALEGFILALSPDGDIVFVSESVDAYLGLNHCDLSGNSFYDYCHPCDTDEVRLMVTPKVEETSANSDGSKDIPCGVFPTTPASYLIRVKCTLTARGRVVNLRSASYKVLRITGRVLEKGNFVGVCEPLPHPSFIERPLDDHSYITKHSLDMKFTHADHKITQIFGYNENEVVGKSFFYFYHALDTVNVESAFKALFAKGQSETSPYRFLAKGGGYCWLLTQATLVKDTHSKPQSIVCINYILSHLEHEDEIISQDQDQPRLASTPTSDLQKDKAIDCEISSDGPPVTSIEWATEPPALWASAPDESRSSEWVPSPGITERSAGPVFPVCEAIDKESGPSPSPSPSPSPYPSPPPSPPLFSEPYIQPLSPFACTSTDQIFAPRTADMNSGFLMLTGDDEENLGLTVLHDLEVTDPEHDLTHLAPEPGDTFVAIDFSTFTDFDCLDMDDIFNNMDMLSCGEGKVATTSPCASSCEISIDEEAVDASDSFSFEDCLLNPGDNKLMPFVPPVVAEEEINFSGDDCDEDCGASDSGISSNSGTPPYKSSSDSDPFDHKLTDVTMASEMSDANGGQKSSPVEGSSASSAGHSDEGSGQRMASPLHNDPFLSFTGGLLDFGSNCSSLSMSLSSPSSSHSTLYGSPRCSTQVHSPSLTSHAGESSPLFCPSSVWDSPPSSNNSLNADLDMCTSIGPHDAEEEEDDEEEDFQSKAPFIPMTDFPLLSEEWDSFINSNLSDIISSDAFLTSKGGGFSDLMSPKSSEPGCSVNLGPTPTLPLTSNLAMLLQQSLPPSSSSSTSTSSSSSGHNHSSPQKSYQSKRSPSTVQRNDLMMTSASGPTATATAKGSATLRVPVAAINGKSSPRTANISNLVTQNLAVQNGVRHQVRYQTVAKGNLLISGSGLTDNRTTLSVKGLTRSSNQLSYGLVYLNATEGVIRKEPNQVLFKSNDTRLLSKGLNMAPPLPPPKRSLSTPGEPGGEGSGKRFKDASGSSVFMGSSVLMNLLVNGEDVTNGYTRKSGLKTVTTLRSNSVNSDLFYSDTMTAIGVNPFGDIR